MEDELVRRRKWLSREKFLDLVGATNLIPGPNSTELAIHIGCLRGGWPGLLVAGICFILPATVIVTIIAWAYVKFGKLPELAAVLYGVKPVVIAIVLQALWRLARTAVKTKTLGGFALAAVVVNFLGVNELIVLFATGGILALAQWFKARRGGKTLLLVPLASPLFASVGATAAAAAPFSLWAMFWFFVKVGSVLFGSGYVLLAFLRADLVERWHWLNEQQLLDAIAVGQVTPGPVFTTATFIGYVLGGFPGAIIGTVGIFLPAFVFVALSGPLIPRIRKSKIAGAFLDGVNVASLALMAVVTYQLGRAALIDVWTLLLLVASFVALIRFKINSAWLVLAGAAIGLLKFFF